MGRILALGGHGFDRREGNQAICDYIVELAGVEHPRVCLLPTASGDPDDQIASFRRAFGERDCDPSEISLFRLGSEPIDLRSRLLAQDVIYVGGGSMVNMLVIWRAHSIADVMRDAWEAGVLICGQSAGAMCWFENGVTTSYGEPRPVPGLGFLPGSACVHYGAEPERRRAFLAAIDGGMPGGYGLDDQAGVLIEGTRVAEPVAARPGATVWQVTREGREPIERRIEVTRLVDERRPIDDVDGEIVELRQTLASRAATKRARRGRRRV